MKKILRFSFFTFLIVTLSLSKGKAQWVTIPDPIFVQCLQANYPACMNGNLMDTTCSGIVNATILDWQAGYIYDLTGIQYFDSLSILICCNNPMTSLPSLPNSLTSLVCTNNGLTNLPLLPNSLINLDCTGNQITSLPLLPNSLIDLKCSYNSLTSLPLLPGSLTSLICNNNLLMSLPSLPNSLTLINCTFNSLTSLSPLPSSLIELYCYNNSLTNLPALPNSLLNLMCLNNSLTSLPSLPTTLHAFDINNNPGIICLPPLQNFTGSSFNISNTGITCLPNEIQHTGYIAGIDALPICDVFNTNGCEVAWNIKGNVVFDADSNCSTTNDGALVPMTKMNLYNSGGYLVQQVIANWGGEYSFDTQLGDYSTSVDSVNIPFNVLCPSNNSIVSNFTAIDSMDYNVDFRLICKPGFDIGAWNVFHQPNFFPGFFNSVYVSAGDVTQSIYNINCVSGINGEIKVVINGPANYFSPIAGALTPTINGDTLIYTIADFSLVNANSAFAFNVITDSTAQTGDQICFDVTVTPTAGDNNVSNNTLTHCFAVSNSYDPNEKEVSPVGSLAYPFNDWLTYTIHFQNTGTATAQHIQLLDTLDADLDASTFQLLSYSHAPMVQLFGSKVHFNFVNINLPDSTTDFEGSKGYVSYRIKPLANLPLGTTIENTASIYFDFNTPVVTNTVSNVICNPISPTNLSETICEGDAYNFNGTNISTAGNYSVTLNAINGCDSVINLSLSVISSSSNSISQSICAGEVFFFNGVNLSSSGIYTDTVNAIGGCDSILTLTLTVVTVNTNIQQTNDTLTALSSGTIQWFDCNSQQIISGANGNIFIPTASGIYSAIITEGTCVDTTSCTQVFTAINELSIDHSQFTVFPNPADENITVTLSQPCENCKIEISNTLGQILISELSNNLNSKIINLKSFPPGVYFIALRSDKMSVVKKLVKD